MHTKKIYIYIYPLRGQSVYNALGDMGIDAGTYKNMTRLSYFCDEIQNFGNYYNCFKYELFQM